MGCVKSRLRFVFIVHTLCVLLVVYSTLIVVSGAIFDPVSATFQYMRNVYLFFYLQLPNLQCDFL